MGRTGGKASNGGNSSNYPPLHGMRARLRKASCMGDDSYDAADVQTEARSSPHQAYPSTRPSPSGAGEPRHMSQTRNHHQQVEHACDMERRGKGQPDSQLQSAFFARFPAEVRRMIFEALWRIDNPLMKMHVYASHDGAKLMTAPCHYEPAATFSTRDDEVDPMRTDPWPGWRGKNQPPRWFWHALGLRLRWGPHWKCQAAMMMHWRTNADGTSTDLRRQRGGWMGAFLSCKRMYTEAIESLFESTTLIFTASEDAYRFLVQRPHAHLSRLRSLDLEFTHFKDHLFLRSIESRHPRLTDADVGGDGGGPTTVPVGWEVWLPLTLALRERTPALASLRVTLSPPGSRGRAEGFYDVLREWEREGRGWVTERADGVVYLEMGRARTGEGVSDKLADEGRTE